MINVRSSLSLMFLLKVIIYVLNVWIIFISDYRRQKEILCSYRLMNNYSNKLKIDLTNTDWWYTRCIIKDDFFFFIRIRMNFALLVNRIILVCILKFNININSLRIKKRELNFPRKFFFLFRVQRNPIIVNNHPKV